MRTIESGAMHRKQNPRTTLVNFKTSASIYAQLREVASEQGVTISTFIHDAVVKALKNAKRRASKRMEA